MNDLDASAVEELADTWDEIREDYQNGGNDAYDRAVLDCAARLAADPGGESAYIWTLGLAMTAPYVAWLPGDGVVSAVTDALVAADSTLRDRPCDHASHPYQTHFDENDEELAEELRLVADATGEEPSAPREEWRCARNVAGFARIARDIVDPGSVTGIPPRLPMEARSDIESLSALLHGCPKPWTDINDTVASAGWGLGTADDPLDRAGHVMVVRAVTWYAVSGMIRAKWVLDDLVKALEETLPTFTGGPCEHGADGHPELPDSGPDAAQLGVMLSSPGGRGVYTRQWGNEVPLETLLCPAFMAAVARETLDLLRTRREELFGRRDTSHADAEYLRPDGRLEIERIAERIDHKHWNEKYAEDLGLWAARRYGVVADARERAVLLLTVGEAMEIAYPGPPLSVLRDVLATLRSAAAVRPEGECAHEAHPPLRYGTFHPVLPHLYAPEEHPAPETTPHPDAWICPRFLAEYADEKLRSLEKTLEDDDATHEA